MPAKAPVDENVRFLYSCLIRSDYHYIDFHMVAADFGINPAAARMRWARLRKNIAQNSSFKNDPNLSPGSGQQNKKRKSNGSGLGAGRKGKMLKALGELDDDDDWIKREMKAEAENGEDTEGFGGEFGMGNADGAGFGQYGMAGIQSGLERGFGPGSKGIGFVGNIGDILSNGEGVGGGNTVTADVLDPMLFATSEASTSTAQGLRNSSLGVTAPPTEGSGREMRPASLPPQPQLSTIITTHPTPAPIPRISSPIPVVLPHMNITDSKAGMDTTSTTTTATTTATTTTSAITDAATINARSVTGDQHANQLIDQLASCSASAAAAAVDGTASPEQAPPAGKDVEYRHDEQRKDGEASNGIEVKGRVMQKEGCANEIAGEENETCRMDKGPTTSITTNSTADTYAGPNVTKEREGGEEQQFEFEQQVMCPPHSGSAYDDDTPPPPPPPPEDEGQVDEILSTTLGDGDLTSELSDLSGLSETEWDNEPVVGSIGVKPHSSPNAELTPSLPGNNKDGTSNEAAAATTAATSGRLLRSANKKRTGDEIVATEEDEKEQGDEKEKEEEEHMEEWVETENEEEEYEAEDSDNEWVE